MKSTIFLTGLFDIAHRTDFGEWVAFRHPDPDVLFAFRFDDNNQGHTFPPVVITYAPNRIAVHKYYGAFNPAIYEYDKAWEALRKVREYLGLY
jgi:hypothetical protein